MQWPVSTLTGSQHRFLVSSLRTYFCSTATILFHPYGTFNLILRIVFLPRLRAHDGAFKRGAAVHAEDKTRCRVMIVHSSLEMLALMANLFRPYGFD